MGVDWGDFDRDGRLDLLVTAFTGQSIKLYHNLGAVGFADVGPLSHISQPSALYIGWGAGFIDIDNSGWLSIIVSNGHVYPQADLVPNVARYRQPILLFRSLRDGTYEDMSSGLGAVLPLASWRGLALGDVNNDGCMDIVIQNIDGPPSLVINHCNHHPLINHRALFKLTGTRSNRAAIGARVILKTKNATQLAEVRGGGSYISQNDLRLHFGLGPSDRIDEVEVRWPSGAIDRIHDLRADFMYNVVEGQGVRSRTMLGLATAAK
jgi:hypothetical protein